MAKSGGSAVATTGVTSAVAPTPRNACTKVRAVRAVVRSSLVSHGDANHQASRPKTKKDQEVLDPENGEGADGGLLVDCKAQAAAG